MHWFRRTLVRIIDQGGGALGQGTASVNAPVGYAEELTAEIAEPAEKTQGKSLGLLRSLQRTGFAFVSKATGDAACAMLRLNCRSLFDRSKAAGEGARATHSRS